MRRRVALITVFGVGAFGAFGALAPSAGADHRGDLCFHTGPETAPVNLVIGYCP
jgi:hypothetical protein